MDIEFERERLQDQCVRLSRYTALVRRADVSPDRRAIQCLQNIMLVKFLSIMQENAFRLIRAPEEAAAVGEDTLEMLRLFLEEYIDLLVMEHRHYEDKNDPPEQ